MSNKLSDNDVVVLKRIKTQLSNIRFDGMAGKVDPYGITIGPPLKNAPLNVQSPSSAGLFVVNLTYNSGADGSAVGGTYPLYAYDVYLRNADASNGMKIGTNLSPVRPRWVKCSHIKATMGTAYYDSTGTAILAEAWEQFNQTNCS